LSIYKLLLLALLRFAGDAWQAGNGNTHESLLKVCRLSPGEARYDLLSVTMAQPEGILPIVNEPSIRAAGRDRALRHSGCLGGSSDTARL